MLPVCIVTGETSRADFARVLCTLMTAAAAGCVTQPSTSKSGSAHAPVLAQATHHAEQMPERGSLESQETPRTIVKAPRLRVGDAVGVVACGSPARSPLEIYQAKDNLARLGLVAVLAPHLSDSDGYLAGTDAVRADAFNRFARDPSIRGIIALRGGYGTMRILDMIDYDALLDDPKVIIGFSDIAALLNAVSVKTGLVTFHGPVAGHGEFSEVVVRGLTGAIMSPLPLGAIASSQLDSADFAPSRSATGRVFGGNLSIVAALCGTQYAVPTGDTVLLLEEVNEAPYRVDRMLTQLRLAGVLENVSAIALGRFVHCVVNAETDDVPSCTVEEALLDRLSDLNRPIVSGLPFGHIADQATIPLGVRATVDSQAQTLTIEESAVS